MKKRKHPGDMEQKAPSERHRLAGPVSRNNEVVSGTKKRTQEEGKEKSQQTGKESIKVRRALSKRATARPCVLGYEKMGGGSLFGVQGAWRSDLLGTSGREKGAVEVTETKMARLIRPKYSSNPITSHQKRLQNTSSAKRRRCKFDRPKKPILSLPLPDEVPSRGGAPGPSKVRILFIIGGRFSSFCGLPGKRIESFRPTRLGRVTSTRGKEKTGGGKGKFLERGSYSGGEKRMCWLADTRGGEPSKTVNEVGNWFDPPSTNWGKEKRSGRLGKSRRGCWVRRSSRVPAARGGRGRYPESRLGKVKLSEMRGGTVVAKDRSRLNAEKKSEKKGGNEC